MRDTNEDLPFFFPRTVRIPKRLPAMVLRILVAQDLENSDRLPPSPYRLLQFTMSSCAFALLLAAMRLSSTSAWSKDAGRAPELAVTGFIMLLAFFVIETFLAKWRLNQNVLDSRISVFRGFIGALFLLILYFFIMGVVFRMEKHNHFSDQDVLHWVEVTPDRTGIVIFTDIKAGTADRFERLLSANPGVRTVHLWSDGGLGTDAHRIAAAIRRNGLDTIAISTCSSACTAIHAAGRKRLVSDARETLGYHSAWLPALPITWAPLGTRSKNQYLDAGYDKDFIDRIETVPAYDLWEPDRSTLLAANAIHGVLASEDTIGVYWLFRRDKNLPDYFADNGWLGASLKAAPQAHSYMKAWAISAWDMARNDKRVNRYRSVYAMRVLAAGLSSALMPADTVREAASTLVAGMKVARDRSDPKSQADCAEIGAEANFHMARVELRGPPGSEKPDPRWDALLPGALAKLPAGWDAQAAPLPPVDAPETWAGIAPAPRGSCAETLGWYEKAIDVDDPEGPGRLRLRFGAIARGEAQPDPRQGSTSEAGPGTP